MTHTIAFKKPQPHLGAYCSRLEWSLDNGVFVYYRKRRSNRDAAGV